MRDIYLIDFENVASEGLTGITNLAEEDEVVIFYSANSNRLSMKMHILMAKSICHLTYFEVSVGGKNALDHQISTYIGYLIGTEAAERNYYIVSKDNGYRHIVTFWANHAAQHKVRCIESIKAVSRFENAAREEEHGVEADTVVHEEKQEPPRQEPSQAAVAEEPETTKSSGDRHNRGSRNANRKNSRNGHGRGRTADMEKPENSDRIPEKPAQSDRTEEPDRGSTPDKAKEPTTSVPEAAEHRMIPPKPSSSFVVFDNTASAKPAPQLPFHTEPVKPAEINRVESGLPAGNGKETVKELA